MELLTALEQRVCDCAAAYLSAAQDDEVRENLQLKLDHTFRVRAEIVKLVLAEKFSEREKMLAEAAALLHDYSRFEQFSKYRSFNDAKSFDHGDRSAELSAALPEIKALAERDELLFAIRGHNKLAVPESGTALAVKLCRALRDADKLDIMRIILDHLDYHSGNDSITFSLNTRNELTPTVARDLAAGRTPKHGDMRTALDFLTAKLVWFDDLNFDSSRKVWLKRDYDWRLLKYLPPLETVSILREMVFLRQKKCCGD